jgi:hypothetical protein
LRAAAARRPLLLVLDDLHWADAPSLALLRFVGWELEGAGLLVLDVYRHTEVDRRHPLVATLADLTRGQHHRRLLLGGLDQQEVASFVALVAGVAPSPRLAAALHQQTDGNPFFVTEVVRLLASQGRLGHAGSPGAGRRAAGGRQGGGGRAAGAPLTERHDALQRDGRAAQRSTATKMHPRRPELPLLLRVEQASLLLGISRSAGYRAATAGDLPILRLGRRLYVPTAPLLTMLGLVAEERP